MLIAFTGPHLSGKTYLASRLANSLQCAHVPCKLADIFSEHGVDGMGAMNFDTRLTVQHAAIARYNALMRQHEGCAVFDRSPIDFSAYMLADYNGRGLSPLEIQAVAEYHAVAMASVNAKRIDTLIVCHPHPDIHPDNGWTPPGFAEQVQKLDNIITAVAFQQAMYCRVIDIPKQLALSDRHRYVCEQLGVSQNASQNPIAGLVVQQSIRSPAG